MPAEKVARQSVKRYGRNHSVRSATRTVLYGARRAIDGGDEAEAQAAVRKAIGHLDRAVKKGILHKNNASRTKSRLATRLHKMNQA
ncbi:MAG: 30S ribosomal protein S20 [Stenotrophomonas maltophilia]